MLKEFVKIFLVTGISVPLPRLLRRTLVLLILIQQKYSLYDPFFIKGKTSIKPTIGIINVTAI